MTPQYTQQLEQIIAQMTGQDIPESEYDKWLSFLQQVYPESELLIARVPDTPPANTSQKSLTYSLENHTDIREIMLLAESKAYPTWFITPKLSGLTLLLDYVQGELQSITFEDTNNWQPLEIKSLASIPETIGHYTGQIKGTLHLADIGQTEIDTDTMQVVIYEHYAAGTLERLRFTADDISTDTDFAKTMQTLQNFGFSVQEYVLFPTEKIQTISSSALELFFHNYISKAENFGLKVEGLVIVSDSPLKLPVGTLSTTRIVYTPK